MKSLNFNDFKNNPLKKVRVEFMDLGGYVYVKELSSKQTKTILPKIEKVKNDPEENMNVVKEILPQIVVDENNDYVFEGHEDVIDDLGTSIIRKLMDAFSEVSGVSNDEIKDAEKN